MPADVSIWKIKILEIPKFSSPSLGRVYVNKMPWKPQIADAVEEGLN